MRVCLHSNSTNPTSRLGVVSSENIIITRMKNFSELKLMLLQIVPAIYVQLTLDPHDW